MDSESKVKRRRREEETKAMPDKPLSINELADFLSVPVGTVYQWRSKGFGPPAIKVGRYLRWRPTDVDEWMSREATNQGRRK